MSLAAELEALTIALVRLSADVARALADGVLSVDEVIAIGADAPSVASAISALATPDDPEIAERMRKAREIRRAARRALRASRRAHA